MRTIAILLCVFLVGCNLRQVTPIQFTTYPQGVSGTRTISWPAKNPVYTTSKSVEMIFTNEREFFIDSSDYGTSDRFKLMEAIPEKAKLECGGEYEIVNTKYYTGGEATSKMLGRKRPWLKVVVRCPIKKTSASLSPGIISVERLTKDVENSNYFDSHSQEFPFRFDLVWNQVWNILADQDDNIWDSDKKKGIIKTDLTRHGIYGFPHYDQYYIVVEKVVSNVTRVSFKIFRYFRYMNTKDSATLLIVNLKPADRHIVYRVASEFIQGINDTMQKQYK